MAHLNGLTEVGIEGVDVIAASEMIGKGQAGEDHILHEHMVRVTRFICDPKSDYTGDVDFDSVSGRVEDGSRLTNVLPAPRQKPSSLLRRIFEACGFPQ